MNFQPICISYFQKNPTLFSIRPTHKGHRPIRIITSISYKPKSNYLAFVVIEGPVWQSLAQT